MDKPPPATGRPVAAESGTPAPPPTVAITTEAEDSASVAGSQPATSGFAPPFKLVTPAAPPARFPAVGEVIEDFRLVEVLGKGAFATVFLAEQLSLGRQVALKVSANRGTEARTLASLEHDHIVRVFQEVVHPGRNLRLLCMQLVNGATLEQVLKALSRQPADEWNGRAILEAIDALATQPTAFDPAALRDRDLLWHGDWVEAVAWLGARLAEALAHAHSQRVLHRDIKPANILLNRYGRPMLADFNVSLDPERVRGQSGPVFGGTILYMAPEHLDAFNPNVATTADAVDERSDIYSLGVVLFETATGEPPFASAPRDLRLPERLRILAERRRAGAPSPRALADVSEPLDWTIRRCLDPAPGRRFLSATELAHALDGCREHRKTEQQLPKAGLLTRAMLRWPFLAGFGLAVVPHLLGSVVNITYNSARIVDRLSEAQQATFTRLVLGYNLVVYTACLGALVLLLAPLVRTWKGLAGALVPDGGAVAAVRRRMLWLPVWVIGLACVGWLPGGLLFPLGIDWFSGPLAGEVYAHFLVSFTISGLIALTYSLFAVQYLVLRVLYPRMWVDPRRFRQQAAEELVPLNRRLRVFQLLAGLIPLAGAVLMVGVGPEQFGPEGNYQTFRVLVTALIALGMLGFCAALLASRLLTQTVTALAGSERQPGVSPRRAVPTFKKPAAPTDRAPEGGMEE